MHFCESKILEIRTENRTNQLNTTIKSTEQIADLHKLLKLYQHSRPQLKKLQEWNETTSSWGNVLGSELCLKAQIPLFDDSLFWSKNQQYFCNNFGNQQNRIWKKPWKFEQEMLSHKGSPGSYQKSGALLLHQRKPCHGLLVTLLFPRCTPNHLVVWSVCC